MGRELSVVQPNLLLILADHLRPDALGCYGTPVAQTPVIDRVAAVGWRFEACYTVCPDVVQSLAWLLAGGQPSVSGFSWLSSLRHGGYRLDVIGCGSPAAPASPAERADQAVDAVKALGKAPPFCLVVHLGDVLTIDPPADVELPEAHVPPPIVVPKAIDDRPKWVRRHHYDSAESEAGDTEHRMQRRLSYYRQASALDRQVGRILQAVEEQGASESTLVAITGLSGCMLGDHELPVTGPFVYDSQVNVPLILHLPGELAGGRVTYALCQLHDLAGTIMDASGTDAPISAASSRLPTSGDLASRSRRAMSYCADQETWVLMVRQGAYKLILYLSPDDGEQIEGELFDLDHDWYEMNNLWELPDYWKIRAELTEEALAWMADLQQPD